PVVLLRHRMSDFPSPLKSPIPVIDQLAGMPVAINAWNTVVAPIISHTATSPVVLLRHRTSELSSPSEAPTPAIGQVLGMPVAMNACSTAEGRFISHSATSPLVVLRHRMSASASPLKSPVPAMLHGAPGLDSMICDVTLVWLTSHICGVPTNGS